MCLQSSWVAMMKIGDVKHLTSTVVHSIASACIRSALLLTLSM